MQPAMNAEDKKKIEAAVLEKYAKVAVSPEALFSYPTGRAGLEALNYDADILRSLPERVLASYCGVGNPFSLGPVPEGAVVLDVGSGGGVDAMVAATMVGPEGRVVGVDLSPEMLALATENLRSTALSNVEFRQISGEEFPFPDAFFDVVISNGVINLIPDKIHTLAEIFRILKPSGRLMLADQVLAVGVRENPGTRVDDWAG